MVDKKVFFHQYNSIEKLVSDYIDEIVVMHYGNKEIKKEFSVNIIETKDGIIEDLILTVVNSIGDKRSKRIQIRKNIGDIITELYKEE